MKLPMQPLVIDKNGVPRFQENRIVRFLLHWATGRGMGLNEIAEMAWAGKFSQEEQTQFAQLIGYSVTGYHELSYVSDAAAQRATEAARQIDETFMACRDVGCAIHCGVLDEEVAPKENGS
jgi:hypothetical protein